MQIEVLRRQALHVTDDGDRDVHAGTRCFATGDERASRGLVVVRCDQTTIALCACCRCFQRDRSIRLQAKDEGLRRSNAHQDGCDEAEPSGHSSENKRTHRQGIVGPSTGTRQVLESMVRRHNAPGSWLRAIAWYRNLLPSGARLAAVMWDVLSNGMSLGPRRCFPVHSPKRGARRSAKHAVRGSATRHASKGVHCKRATGTGIARLTAVIPRCFPVNARGEEWTCARSCTDSSTCLVSGVPAHYASAVLLLPRSSLGT